MRDATATVGNLTDSTSSAMPPSLLSANSSPGRCSLNLPLLVPTETDLPAPLGFWRRRHELPDGLDQLHDRVVMRSHFLLELGQLAREFLVGGDELTKLDE